MKRILSLLLGLALLLGCAHAAPAVPAVQSASAPTQSPRSAVAPEPTATVGPQPDDAAPLTSLLFYSFEEGWHEGDVLFRFDLDQDGVEEGFSFALRPDDKFATAVTWGDGTIILEEGDEPVSAEVVDLDPESPFYNLLMVFDSGSDSYVTAEVHPENGRLVQGKTIYGSYGLKDGAIWFAERSDLLGTNFGCRSYHGDDLVPDSVWLDMIGIPTEEELATRLEGMIDIGVVIHCAKAVPCVIDGQAATLPEDTLFYPLRFMDPDVDLVMEVRTLDGVVAQLFFFEDEDEPHDPHRIYEPDQDEYFDNLLYAD